MNENLEEQRARIHQKKREWHQEQAKLPFGEKMRILLEMQRSCLPIIESRRALKWWEKPWDIEP
ncbi:MAG: hypothetical protein KY445_13125 [Armatimonadetes bacterium]|nr:hypothetical protein [Armatimonadota bacterium]